jgi:hypothetical protein
MPCNIMAHYCMYNGINTCITVCPINKIKEISHEMTKINLSIGDTLITVSHSMATTLSCVYHCDQLRLPQITMVGGNPLSDDLHTVILNMALYWLSYPYNLCPLIRLSLQGNSLAQGASKADFVLRLRTMYL